MFEINLRATGSRGYAETLLPSTADGSHAASQRAAR